MKIVNIERFDGIYIFSSGGVILDEAKWYIINVDGDLYIYRKEEKGKAS